MAAYLSRYICPHTGVSVLRARVSGLFELSCLVGRQRADGLPVLRHWRHNRAFSHIPELRVDASTVCRLRWLLSQLYRNGHSLEQTVVKRVWHRECVITLKRVRCVSALACK